MNPGFNNRTFAGVALCVLLLLVAVGIFVLVYLTVMESDRIGLAGVAAFIESLAFLSVTPLLKIYNKERNWEKARELYESLRNLGNSLGDERYQQLVEDTYRKQLALID